MKTLVVLSALAAVALAAPALLDGGSEDFKKIITNDPETFKRERKATQEPSQLNNPTSGSQTNLPSTSQLSELSGRSFVLKKPIIIKKKQGYHVYRDSDEEQAASDEKCGKQVKVKLCDVKSEDTMRNTIVEDVDAHMTQDDMKQSIKLAKEAVENLQRDLKIVERKPGSEASWNHGHSASDSELHQDIEVAREALEHIHKNFGNLESMSLHATTLNDADTFDDVQFNIANTEEQRLAQWKEAMDTIHKNREIAKNIEKSFKDASGETGLLFTDDMIGGSNKQEPNKATNHIMRTTENLETKDENKVDSVDCKNEPAHGKSSEKDGIKAGLIEDDMASSASTVSEKKEDIHVSEKARQPSLPSDMQIDETMKFDHHPTKKEADIDPMISQDLLQKHNLVSDSMKRKEENKERTNEFEQTGHKPELTENADNIPVPAINKMKSVESEDILVENKRNAVDTDNTQSLKSLKHEEHLEKTESVEKKHHKMKSAEHIEQSNKNLKEDQTHEKAHHTEKAKEIDTTMLVKSAEEVSVNTQTDSLTDTKKHESTAHKHSLEQHFIEPKIANHQDLKQQTVMFAPKNTADQVQFHHHKEPELHSEMRRTDDFKNMHQHQLLGPSQTRWAEDKNFNAQMESMKSADGVHSQSMDHVHSIQHPGHHHHVAHTAKNHHFDTQSGHGQLHPRFHDNFMTQGKSADEMQSYYMNMRDGSGPDNQRFRWKPSHESSRSAYGAPTAPASSSSGGAVGLFPNANVGSCGIPLLLSCNPSVVSGSLSKPHPAPYSAPAYRTEDDFNFLTKRDLKKTYENIPNHMHRAPTNVNLKSSNVLVAKQ